MSRRRCSWLVLLATGAATALRLSADEPQSAAARAADPGTMPFSRSALLKRFDTDGDGALSARERASLRQAFGGVDVPMLAWPPPDYRTVRLPAHFQRAGVAQLDNAPADNPLTDAGATLGRVLFFDRQLSQNNSVACASCHRQQAGFADPRRFSVGFAGGHTKRNSMGLANLRYTNLKDKQAGFFWDERAPTLEALALMPIQDKLEMGMELAELERKLQTLPYYLPLFDAAFGSPEVTTSRVAKALAQFLRSIVSTHSRFDEAAAKADDPSADFAEFTEPENLGKRLFMVGADGIDEFACAMCHEPPTFRMAQAMNIGLDRNYADAGLGALGRSSNDPFTPSNDGKFRAPSLRNIALTAPYMHDGRFKTLAEVLNHYSEGVHSHPNLSLAIRRRRDGRATAGFGFSGQEKAALVAFLKTLTDERLVADARFSDPFPRDDDPPSAEGSAAEQYKALVEQFQQRGRAGELADKFVTLAEKYPDDPVAVDALGWVVINVRDGDKPGEAAEILLDRHIKNARLGAVAPQLVGTPSLVGEKLLRSLLDKSPHSMVQAQACFNLAAHLQQQRTIRESIQSQPASRRKFEQFYGKPFTRHIVELDEAKLAKEIEQLYERVVRSFGDLDEAMTDAARTRLVELRHLAIGKPAMQIEGEDIDGVRFKLSDYRGKVVVLSFWGHW